jgi:hypothetical protein
MRFSKTLILLTACIILSTGLQAQSKRHRTTKSFYTKERYNSKAAHVSRHKAKIVCPIFEVSKFPYHGLGLKLGDPFAVTYKFYPNKKWGIVADVGKASSGLYNRYYIEKFDEYAGSAATDTISYLSHRVKADYVGELKVLYHFDATALSPGLMFYVGAGWQVKSTKLQYSFTYDTSPSVGSGVRNEIDRLDRSRFTQGPQVVMGIEYSYFQMPISAFMEVEYFQDVVADPGWRKFEGGVGLRYIF